MTKLLNHKMNIVGGLAVSALFASGSALAGGLQRTNQSVMVLFQEGNYAEISYTHIVPDIEGEGELSGASSGDTLETFNLPAGAVKVDLTDRVSAAVIVDKPFGLDLSYDEAQPEFGGSKTEADSLAITGVLGYRLPYQFTIFGGVRQQQVQGDVTLQGLGYGALSGYNADFRSDWGTGYLAGIAYERPEIGMRIAFTYNSEIEHKLPTRERLDTVVQVPGAGAVPVSFDQNSVTQLDTPESWVLEARSGIAPNTLAFGSVRYVEHGDVQLAPSLFQNLAGRGLVDFDDTITYEFGLGYRFTDYFSGLVSGMIEDGNSAPYTPLRVAGDREAVTVGGAFQLTENINFGTGISYGWLDGSSVSTSGPVLTNFNDGRYWAISTKIGMNF